MASVVTIQNASKNGRLLDNSYTLSHLLAKKGFRVLHIDCSFETASLPTVMSELPRADVKEVRERNPELSTLFTRITDQLDYFHFAYQLPRATETLQSMQRTIGGVTPLFLIEGLLEGVRMSYDYVLLFVDPSEPVLMENALLASDYVAMMLETASGSFYQTAHFKSLTASVNEKRERFNKHRLSTVAVIPQTVNFSTDRNDRSYPIAYEQFRDAVERMTETIKSRNMRYMLDPKSAYRYM